MGGGRSQKKARYLEVGPLSPGVISKLCGSPVGAEIGKTKSKAAAWSKIDLLAQGRPTGLLTLGTFQVLHCGVLH